MSNWVLMPCTGQSVSLQCESDCLLCWMKPHLSLNLFWTLTQAQSNPHTDTHTHTLYLTWIHTAPLPAKPLGHNKQGDLYLWLHLRLMCSTSHPDPCATMRLLHSYLEKVGLQLAPLRFYLMELVCMSLPGRWSKACSCALALLTQMTE